MIKFEISYAGPSITDVDINRLENEFQIKLPEDYRTFLLETNGGRPIPRFTPMSGDPFNPTAEVNWLYCINKGDTYDLATINNMMAGRFPEGFFAIGEDSGGNKICIDTTPQNYGKVYFWDHEEEVEEGEIPGFQNVYFMANSFTEMMENISDDPNLEMGQNPNG